MSPFALLLLSACGRYWFDTAEVDLGELSLEVGTVRLEGDYYRPDWRTMLALSGEARVEGLAGEQEWNQLQLLLDWVPAVDDQGVRAYGLSLWDLSDTSEDDERLLRATASLGAVQVDASRAGAAVQLEGAIEGAGAEGDSVRFTLGLMLEDISGRPTEAPPLVGPAALLLTANGLNRGSEGQPSLSVAMDESE